MTDFCGLYKTARQRYIFFLIYANISEFCKKNVSDNAGKKERIKK